MSDNVFVPAASSYGLGEEYEYLKGSIEGYLTGPFARDNCLYVPFFFFLRLP